MFGRLGWSFQERYEHQCKARKDLWRRCCDFRHDGTCLKWIGKLDAGGFSGAVAVWVGGPLAVESHPAHT